jgi:selenocysteine lyase/cysteine desulfurase
VAGVTDILATIARLDEAARNAVTPTLQHAERLVEEARRDLGSFDDAAARQALAIAEQALDGLRNVLYGWMVDYQRIANEMSHRLLNN